MTQIWPKRAIFEFYQKIRKRHFFRLRLDLVQKIANSNERIAKKNAKNIHFWHFGPKWPILDSFGQNGQNGNFFKKALGTFFSHLQALTHCKVSEKNNERFREKALRTNEHTNVRTNTTPKVSNDRCSRDQKISKF